VAHERQIEAAALLRLQDVDHVSTPAEDESREKELNAYLATTARDQDKQSGARAKYRKLGGSMLLQELLYKK
jgi:hypothetical protein